MKFKAIRAENGRPLVPYEQIMREPELQALFERTRDLWEAGPINMDAWYAPRAFWGLGFFEEIE